MRTGALDGETVTERIGEGQHRPVAWWGTLFLLLADAVAFAALLALFVLEAPDPSLHASGATLAALGGYVGLHAAIGLVIAGFALMQARRGFVSATRRLPVEVAWMWQTHAGVAGILALVLIHVLAGF